jgi:tRNA(adenine34) deaminase
MTDQNNNNSVLSQGHEFYMEFALKQAQLAFEKGDVPVGAVVVQGDSIIGRGHNQIESLRDPTAHAEMIAITAASNALESWHLDDARIYVTIEPCVMCVGAILNSRIKAIIYGAAEERTGACSSRYNLVDDNPVSPGKVQVIKGILERECRAIMQDFFKKLREKK